MARLSLYLPPLAGDYSGVCSTLFGLNCLVIIVDANCCTRNYVEYDEPRWARRRKTAFSAQLRTLEAVMGDDARIIDQACEAVEELSPACVAIIGSPVPAIMGMDLAGMAMEVESRTGVPSLGLPTTGFETYERGVSLALDALIERFCGAGVRGTGDATRLRVNVLGLSPHDFADEADMGRVRSWLAEAGIDVAFCPDGAYTLGDVAAAAGADASLVVAWSGLAAARRLQEEHGVPYVVGRPLCAVDAAELARELRAVAVGTAAASRGGAATALLAGGAACASAAGDSCEESVAQSGVGSGVAASGLVGALSSLDAALSDATPVLAGLLDELPAVSVIPGPLPEAGEACEPAPLLIVGEQAWANAVRDHARGLRAGRAASVPAAPARPVVVASLFAMDDALMEPGDVRLADEAALQDFARTHPGFAWIGDPLLARIPELGATAHFAVPHEALSSTLYERERAVFSGEGLLPALEGFIAELWG